VPVCEGLVLCYEVHFYRHAGTLGMRVLTAATTEREALFTLRSMRCAEFSGPKVFQGLNRSKAAEPVPILDYSEAANLDFKGTAECLAAVQGDQGKLVALNRCQRKDPLIQSCGALIQTSAS
jgi:hypothetical protein